MNYKQALKAAKFYWEHPEVQGSTLWEQSWLNDYGVTNEEWQRALKETKKDANV